MLQETETDLNSRISKSEEFVSLILYNVSVIIPSLTLYKMTHEFFTL